MALLVLTSTDVDKITSSFNPEDLASLSQRVFTTLSSSPPSQTSTQTPHRTSIQSPSHTNLFMPSRIAEMGTAIKIVSVPVPGAGAEKGGIPASTLVLDEITGSVKAIVNARSLTALRTASGSLLATRLLARSLNPTHLLAFGAGAQIQAHIFLHLAAYPTLHNCTIINRSLSDRFSSLLSGLREKFPGINFIAVSSSEKGYNPELWVREADIICAATPSTNPLFIAEHLKKGVHINLVGSYKPSMHEVDTETIRLARKVVVDSRDACASEAGELIDATLDPVKDMIELGELLIDQSESKINQAKAGDITLFKSVGVGLQDVAIAELVVRRAEKLGVGKFIGDYD